MKMQLFSNFLYIYLVIKHILLFVSLHIKCPNNVYLKFLQIDIFIWYIVSICLTWHDIGHPNLGDQFLLGEMGA